jgi:transcriptional regulator with XRE-family HTH domain
MLRIKELRRKKGLTAKELAEKIGMTLPSLNQKLTGNPTVNTLKRIAKALDVNVVDLFDTPPQNDAKDNGNKLTALINYKDKFYKANTINELKDIVKEIERNK